MCFIITWGQIYFPWEHSSSFTMEVSGEIRPFLENYFAADTYRIQQDFKSEMLPFPGSFLCYLSISIHISHTTTSSLLRSDIKSFNPQVHFAVNRPERINAFLTYSTCFLQTKGLYVMLPTYSDFTSENIIFV